jgi:hypothetical protein
MSFKIGQDVVCVNSDFPPHIIAIYDMLVEKDEVYTIRGIEDGVIPTHVDEKTKGQYPKFHGPKTQILYLDKVINKINPVSKKEPGFISARFVPLKTEEESEEIEESIKVGGTIHTVAN